MKRQRKEASQRSKRSRHRDSVSSEDASATDDDVQPTNIAMAGGSSESDENEEEALLDFTQTDYAVQMSQAALTEEGEDGDEGGKKTDRELTKPKALHKLTDKALEELMAKLVRYMLYKGGLKLPIKFTDISKDVFPQYKNVSRYFFFCAKQKIESVFGYRVVRVKDSLSKESYLVLNNASSQKHLLLMNKTGNAPSRGFLMIILGLLWCAPARRLSEGDLWKQLIRLDRKVKLKLNHPLLGDIPLLLKTFESQLYLDATSELDPDLKKIKYYQYGPRTFLEVSKVQILNFVCKLITGRPPSEMQVDEVLAEDS